MAEELGLGEVVGVGEESMRLCRLRERIGNRFSFLLVLRCFGDGPVSNENMEWVRSIGLVSIS